MVTIGIKPWKSLTNSQIGGEGGEGAEAGLLLVEGAGKGVALAVAMEGGAVEGLQIVLDHGFVEDEIDVVVAARQVIGQGDALAEGESAGWHLDVDALDGAFFAGSQGLVVGGAKYDLEAHLQGHVGGGGEAHVEVALVGLDFAVGLVGAIDQQLVHVDVRAAELDGIHRALAVGGEGEILVKGQGVLDGRVVGHLAVGQHDAALAEAAHGSHVVAYEEHGAPFAMANVLHSADGLFLELGIAHGQHLVDHQYVGVEEGGYGEAQAHPHARRVALDGGVEVKLNA